jgi:hypothetical protein
LSAVPRPEDWKNRWEQPPPEGWAETVDRAVFASLAIPIELSDEAVVKAYNAWLERDVLEPMRTLSPGRYQAIIEYIQTFVLSAKDDPNEEEKTTTTKGNSKASEKARKARAGKATRKTRGKAKS